MVVSKVLYLPVMFFLSPRNQREALPHDRKLPEFYNASPNIREALAKKIEKAKTCNIWCNFIQL